VWVLERERGVLTLMWVLEREWGVLTLMWVVEREWGNFCWLYCAKIAERIEVLIFSTLAWHF